MRSAGEPMRKSKCVYILVMTGILLATGLIMGVDSQRDVVRVHQHQEQPSEEELGVCQRAGEEFCTHLPIVMIDTGGQKIPGRPVEDAEGNLTGYEKTEDGEEEILVTLKTVERKGVWHHVSDAADLTEKALLRVRGKSSRWFDKASYKIKLVSGENPQTNKTAPLLGMDKGNEWALHGPFLDKTLLRNYMWMNLSAEIMGSAPDVRFCELILDGEYQGVYVLMEMISVGEGRVEIQEYKEGDPVFSYIVRLEQDTDPEKEIENFTFYTERMEPRSRLELQYPTRSHQTDAVKEYVEVDFSEIERRLFSSEMAADPDSCWEYLDMKSFADYYIIMEYLAVNDMFGASTYFYKDVRGKLHIGPVWDFNNALDNFFVEMPETEFLLNQKGWYSQLMKSPRFVEYVIWRYEALRNGPLEEERIEDYVTETVEWLGSAVKRNFGRWGDSFDPMKLSRQERRNPTKGESKSLRDLNPSSYEEAIQWMLDYAARRGRWLDEHMDSLRQYSHPSRNMEE